MSNLTLPDLVTIRPVGDATVHPHTRQALGRRQAATVTVLCQIEIGRDRLRSSDIIERDADGVILFDSPPETASGADAGYTPAQGDRVLSVVHNATGASETIGLYLTDPKPDGAGGLIRCLLSAREPERSAA